MNKPPLNVQGYREEAANLIEANNHLKQTVTFCGMSISIEKAQEMGLKVNARRFDRKR